MSPANDESEKRQLAKSVQFHKVLNILLGAGLTIHSFVSVFQWYFGRTIIAPPEINRPYEIGPNFGSRDYLVDQADYVLFMINTVTPHTVDHNNKIVLKMADPDGNQYLKTELDAAALRIKREGITTVWEPNSYKVSTESKWVRVSGVYKTYIGDKLVSNTQREFEVQFSISLSGHSNVSSVKEIVRNSSGKPADANQ